MLRFIAASLLAVLVTACANQSRAQTNSRPLMYEKPSLLTGTLYPKVPPPQKVLYNFTRTAARAGNKITVQRNYTYPDGKPAARERVIYDGDNLIFYALDELQIGAAGSATIRREPGNPAKGTIVFEYTKDLAAGGKAKTDTEALRPDTLVSDMVAPFLAARWDELARGDKVRCRYIVVMRRETVGFTFVKEGETTYQSKKALIVRMEATSPIIARLVDPLYFTIGKDAQHPVYQLLGRTTPKLKVGDAYEDLDALTVFHWTER